MNFRFNDVARDALSGIQQETLDFIENWTALSRLSPIAVVGDALDESAKFAATHHHPALSRYLACGSFLPDSPPSAHGFSTYLRNLHRTVAEVEAMPEPEVQQATADSFAHWAAEGGHVGLLEELLDKGVDPTRKDDQSRSAIDLAKVRAHTPRKGFLIRFLASLNRNGVWCRSQNLKA